MANQSIGEVSGGLSGLGAVNKMKAAARKSQANQASTGASRNAPMGKPAWWASRKGAPREGTPIDAQGRPLRNAAGEALHYDSKGGVHVKARMGTPINRGKPSARTNVLAQARNAERKALQLRVEGESQASVAKFALSGGNREKAGKAAIAAVQKLKLAAILQHRAQKTAGVIGLENAAMAREQHAQAVEQGIRTGTDPFGGAGMDGQKALAGQLRMEAKALRTRAAMVAQLPDQPPGLPTEKRIAEVASKFHVRLQLRQHPGELPLHVIASLQGLGSVDDPVSMVESNDPETVLNYYGGADDLGAMMARIDTGDDSGFVFLSGLAGLGDLGIGVQSAIKRDPKVAAAATATKEKKATATADAAYAAATAASPTVIGPDGTPVPAVVGPDGILVPDPSFKAGEGFFSRNLVKIGGAILAVGVVGGGLLFWARRKK
mgnify:CR=1 FL=1